MLKKNISILFTLLFMATITLPSILIMVDDSIDVSFFYDINEEEEKEEKGNEKNKEIETLFENLNADALVFLTSKKDTNLGYRYKTYPKPHLNLISPPPEFV